MPLDRTIQELESRLPDLRHLIADGEIVLATSESAALLADELESLLSRADTVASRLRQLLLGGTLPSLSALVAAPAVPAPEPPLLTEPPAPVNAAVSEPAAWSEMDDELARIMGIETESTAEETETTFDRRKLGAFNRKHKLPAAAPVLEGLSATERELKELEEKLGLAATPVASRAHLEELEALARQVIEDQEQIKELWREMGIDPNALDESPGKERPEAGAEGTPRDP